MILNYISQKLIDILVESITKTIIRWLFNYDTAHKKIIIKIVIAVIILIYCDDR